MALVLVALFVLVPLALLINDLVRGGEPVPRAQAAQTHDENGHRVRAPRPHWPAKTS